MRQNIIVIKSVNNQSKPQFVYTGTPQKLARCSLSLPPGVGHVAMFKRIIKRQQEFFFNISFNVQRPRAIGRGENNEMSVKNV